METTYKQAEVDALLKDTTPVIQELMEECIKLADENKDLHARLEAQATKMAEKQAESEKVVLEKVAQARNGIFDVREIRDLVDGMKLAGYIVKEEDAKDVMRAISADPGQLLKVAAAILELSTPAPISGQGVNKTAGHANHGSNQGLSSEWVEDGWLDIIRSGEC